MDRTLEKSDGVRMNEKELLSAASSLIIDYVHAMKDADEPPNMILAQRWLEKYRVLRYGDDTCGEQCGFVDGYHPACGGKCRKVKNHTNRHDCGCFTGYHPTDVPYIGSDETINLKRRIAELEGEKNNGL